MQPTLMLILLGAITCAAQPPGFHVGGPHLLDRCGQRVVLRGVNEMTTWASRSGSSLREIAKTGANCVRIVAMTSDRASDLDNWMRISVENGMIPMPELHDATGEWSKLGLLFDHWTKPEILSVVKKHEKHILLNIGNEVGNGQVTAAQWKADYASGIKRMRAAGIRSVLVVDAPDWGKNIDVVQAAALDLLAEDPEKNLLFSVHAYWPYMWGWTDQKVKDELQATVDKGIPFIIGEFGNAWEQSAQGAIPYKLILEECQRLGIGWLAWSWGPGNNPQRWLDMTSDGRYSGLRDWGLEVAETLPTSIKKTSIKPVSLAGGTCLDTGLQPPRPGMSAGRSTTLIRSRGGLLLPAGRVGSEGQDWTDARGRTGPPIISSEK